MEKINSLQGTLLTSSELQSYLQLPRKEVIRLASQVGEEMKGLIIKDHNICCQRCQNVENFYYEESLNLVYCLQCLNLSRISNQDSLYYFPSIEVNYSHQENHLFWQGKLSKEQENIAKILLANLEKNEKPDLVHAVTGSGKTEMIYPLISQVLSNMGRVCVASPRIDVCLELLPRIQAAFNNSKVILLYGQSEDRIQFAPITISTTHQLLRFKNAFDLLIIDEVDSFPYVNEPTLHFAVKRAIKTSGKLVYLTATPDQELEKEIDADELYVSILPARYHRHPLPIPKFSWLGDWRLAIKQRNKNSKLWRKLTKFLSISGSKLIFMPNISLAEELFRWIVEESKIMILCVHAQDPDRKTKIQALRDEEIEGLVTTTILERGVTFVNCHVFVIGAEHQQYSKSSLVQISGRVGRKREYPNGVLIYGHQGKSLAMVKARKEILKMNSLAIAKGLIG